MHRILKGLQAEFRILDMPARNGKRVFDRAVLLHQGGNPSEIAVAVVIGFHDLGDLSALRLVSAERSITASGVT